MGKTHSTYLSSTLHVVQISVHIDPKNKTGNLGGVTQFISKCSMNIFQLLKLSFRIMLSNTHRDTAIKV